jgi:hypothetical protein
VEELICDAIRARKLIRFHYASGSAPGPRTVEPHVVGVNTKGAPALQAWFRTGDSASRYGEGWREYLLAHVSQVEVLEETFDGPRPGYKPGGGKSFRSAKCAV